MRQNFRIVWEAAVIMVIIVYLVVLVIQKEERHQLECKEAEAMDKGEAVEGAGLDNRRDISRYFRHSTSNSLKILETFRSRVLNSGQNSADIKETSHNFLS
ncbi:uncharacterized protein LOC135170598 [Diachasmimorpha longicaudata]|uniref:uncharacterized protein LOC135170598 n=1 Tax=Diachasmimorpha longicaudata TaxID=58733 RepID=UPI0030B8E7D6